MPNANAIANVFKLIEENDIKFALLRFTDIKGKEHGVSIPVSLVDEDMFEDGKMFDGSSVEGWKTINKADMLLMPIAETAVVDPFAQIPTLSIRCSIYEPTTMQAMTVTRVQLLFVPKTICVQPVLQIKHSLVLNPSSSYLMMSVLMYQ